MVSGRGSQWPTMLEHAVTTRRPLRYGQVLSALGQTPPLFGSL
jgi:hypothetical protein